MDNLIYLEQALDGFDENTIREVVARICDTPLADGDHLQVQIISFFPEGVTRVYD